ncbi:MAG: hypothetical protein JW963_25245 [Anaerolineales bacterium]|nr:hypothetical protein [Anaerolineales bacterium]
MKARYVFILVLVLALSACSGSATPAISSMDSYVSPNLDTTYEGALSARNLLAMGTLELEGTANSVTTEQAGTLLPLWQALLGTQKSGAAAPAEVTALLDQIESIMTSEQLAAINALQLTQTDLQAWAVANGIALGSGGVEGGGQPGQGQALSAEERATRQAAEGRTPGNTGGGASTAMLTAVITYLETLSP